jgi:hypothetical protein
MSDQKMTSRRRLPERLMSARRWHRAERGQVTPARGSGGYDHWHCQLKRRHEGKHRYTWIGSGFGVEHEPADA